MVKVNLKVWPFIAPVIVEYSPANEQPEIVTIELLAGIAADPKALPKAHWLWAEYLVNNSTVSTKKYIFFINIVWLIKYIIPSPGEFSGGEVMIFF